MQKKTDAELVEMVRELGDTAAYGQLVIRYQGHAFGLAYSILGDWAEAEDIAQEAFIRAYVNLHTLNEPAKFPSWLRRIVFSTCITWLRTFRPELYRSMGEPSDVDELEPIPDTRTVTPMEHSLNNEMSVVVLSAIADLPQKYRIPLTMFHLDGLSYKKVADFLEIPIGTVRSLINRAKKKLKPALESYAQEVFPMLNEVFDEHKPTEELVSKVLQNIADLEYPHGAQCTFSGSVAACMDFLENKITHEYIMGVSGSAFKLLWCVEWCPSNNALLVLGEEPIIQTFRALGYDYELEGRGLGEKGNQAVFRKKVIESIQKNRPVIAEGVVGPPELGIITGYEENGDIVLGRSYFYNDSKGYYKKADWYQDCDFLLLIGEKKGTLKKTEILCEALEWATKLARTDVWYRGDGAKYFCGLAAYDAWADALRRDDDFPEGDLEALTFRCHVSNCATLQGLRDARAAAAKFLRNMADDETSHLQKAAAVYEEEVHILSAALKFAPLHFSTEEQRFKMADPELRAKLADMIMQAKIKDIMAVEHLEQALAAMSSR